MNWKLFYMLVLTHLLYDFHWQGAVIGKLKGKYDFILFVHALTWAMLLGLSLWAFSVSFLWWRFGFLLVTHFFIDRWKSRQPKGEAYWHLVYVDQALHLITLLAVTCIPVGGKCG